MSTHNICFCQEIGKYQHFPAEKVCLSGAMIKTYKKQMLEKKHN